MVCVSQARPVWPSKHWQMPVSRSTDHSQAVDLNDDVGVLKSGLGLRSAGHVERTGSLPCAVQVLDDPHGVTGKAAAVSVGADGDNELVAGGGVQVDGERVVATRAHALRAVVALPAAVALAALDLGGVPVGGSVGAELADVLAGTVLRAVVALPA